MSTDSTSNSPTAHQPPTNDPPNDPPAEVQSQLDEEQAAADLAEFDQVQLLSEAAEACRIILSLARLPTHPINITTRHPRGPGFVVIAESLEELRRVAALLPATIQSFLIYYALTDPMPREMLLRSYPPLTTPADS